MKLIDRTLLSFCLLFSLCSIDARPKGSNRVEKSVKNLNYQTAVTLLHRYGYFQESNETSSKPSNPLDPIYPKPVETLANALTQAPDLFHQAIRGFQHQYDLKVTGVLDGPTSALLTAPRCGNPDNVPSNQSRLPGVPMFKSRWGETRSLGSLLKRVKRYDIGDKTMKWTKKVVTWQIRSYPTSSLNRMRTHAVFQHTFNMWSKVIDLELLEEKDYNEKADIIIQFGSSKHGDSIPFDGEGGVLAHAFYPTPDNVYSFSGDAHFDDDEIWNDGPHNDKRNLVSVAAHELGHSMGLGHSNVPAAIMFPYYISTWKRVKLDTDDIEGMQRIYGAAKPGKIIPPEPELPVIPPPPPPSTASPERGKVFDYCNEDIDVIIKIRDLELYIFKGPWQWRVTWSKTVSTWVSYQFRDGPAKITYYWPALPKDVDYIDAGIEREDTGIYMFRGQRFWLLKDNMHMMSKFPVNGLPLTDLGLPARLTKVDTVFKWDENKQIYIFAGDQYWKFNTKQGPYGRVLEAPDYPRWIKDVWRGVPYPVQMAFTGLNGETLFFNGTQYYEFDNVAMHTRSGFPKPARLEILGCIDNE